MDSQDVRDMLPPCFQSVEPCAKGAFGLLFRGVDSRGRTVALKVLSTEVADQPHVMWQFTSEFRRLQRLDHRAFPRAFEEGRTRSGLPYYSMEWVQGESPAGPMPAADVRRILVSLAEALSYLHAVGFVHGDLKPENLKLSPEGHVTVLDVGSMELIGQPRSAVQGTLEYLAPEALRREPIDPHADLYAMGVIGYQLWSGKLPFSGNPGELVRAHLQAPPPALHAALGEADPVLEGLLKGLLQKDPARRPTSAEDVLEALGQSHGTRSLRRLVHGTFIGRQEILATWRESLAASGPRFLLVRGAEGSGKTRALDEVRCEGELQGWTWVGSACVGSREAPASPVRAIVRQALKLANLEPEGLTLAWLCGEHPPELKEMAPATLKRLLQDAAIQALGRAAQAIGGLAIGLDDYHLADPSSREFVSQLLCQPAQARLALALAAHPDESLDSTDLRTMDLAPLERDESRALISARLGGACPAQLAEQVYSFAAGNPLRINMLLEHLVATHQLTATPQGWEFRLSHQLGAAREGLMALLADRVRRLSPPARQLMSLMALALPAGDLPAPVFGRVLGLDDRALAEALEALSADGMISGSQGLFRFAIPAVASLVAASEEAPTRERWASALAAALQEPQARAPDIDTVIKAAWLALQGEDDALALALASEAGQRALDISDPANALELLSGAASRMMESSPRLEVLLPKAEAERMLDKLDEAIADYRMAVSAAETANDREAQARALNGLAKCHQMKGDYAEALRVVTLASEQAEVADASIEVARAALTEARLRLFAGELPLAMEACRRAATIAQESDLLTMRAQALNLHGALLAQRGGAQAEEGMGMLREALAISERLGDRLGMGHALDNLGNVHLALGDLSRAAEAFERFSAICRELGLTTEAISADLNRALVASEQGRFPEALTLAQDVARRASEKGRKFLLGAVRAIEAQGQWRSGHPAEAFDLLEQALAIAEEIKNRYLEEHVRLYRLEAFTACGQLSRAREEATRLESLLATSDHAETLTRMNCHLAELSRLGGETLAAARLDELGAMPNRWVRHRLAQVRAEIALTRGDDHEALSHARHALELAQGWSAPWHEATDRLLVARVEHGRGKHEEAALHARQVLGGDANLWAQAGAAKLLISLGDRTAIGALHSVQRKLQGLRLLTADDRRALLETMGLADWELRPEREGGWLNSGTVVSFAEALALAKAESEIHACLLESLMAAVHAERGYLLSFQDGQLVEAVTRGIDYEAEIQGGFSHSIAEHVLFAGEPLYLVDASADASWSANASVMALGLRTVICVPYMTPERILGVVYMDRGQVEPLLLPEDLALLRSLATMAAAACLRERERLQVECLAHQHRLCAEVGLQLARAPQPADALRHLVDAARRAIAATHAYWLVREAQGGWLAEIALGQEGQPLAIADRLFSGGVADWVLEHQDPLSLLDAGSEAGWQSRQSVMALGLRTVFCVPVSSSAVLYLDVPQIVDQDPQGKLRLVQALLDYARPLLAERA